MATQHNTQDTQPSAAHQASHPAPAELLLRLKGAPLSVLLSLAGDGPQNLTELSDHTGWWAWRVKDALVQLARMGLVQRVGYRSWAIRAGVDVAGLFGLPAASTPPTDGVYPQRSPHHNRIAHHEGPTRAESWSRQAAATHSHDVVVGKNIEFAHLDHLAHLPTATSTDIQRLVDNLLRLDPPFEQAEVWLRDASPALVEAWLDYLQSIGRDARRRIRNESAFIRAKVAAGKPPRQRRPRHQPCPYCGKAFRDEGGRCLVCAGVVSV